jgi:pimeloyl-ACP methyl ester carboxylesterase
MLKRLWKGALALVILLALVVGAGLGYRAWRQHGGEALMRIATANGVDDALFVALGGMPQWVTIRGHDRDNPVILVLHGGPGAPMGVLSFLAWEREYTIVQWHQPGAGRTFLAAGRILPADLTIESVVEDGIELTEWLRRRLGKDKVIVLGLSFGSVLGVQMVRARPELFSAYVGTGQIVAPQEAEAIAYASVLAKARQRGDSVAIAELEAIGAPPYDAIAKTAVQRKWAVQYELGHSLTAEGLPEVVAPRTTLAELYYAGADFFASTRHFFGATMAGPLMQVDLRRIGLDYAVPMFVIQGTSDDFTPAELSRAWLDSISAPQKAFVPLENVGHLTLPARNEEFLQFFRERVRPLAAG